MPVSKPVPEALNTLITVQPLFSSLPQNAREQLISDSTLIRFSAGERLIEEDKKNNFLYLILKGKATAMMNGTAAGYLEAGDVAGEISAIGISPPIASIIADTELETVAFPAEAIVQASQSYAEFASLLRKAAFKRVSS